MELFGKLLSTPVRLVNTPFRVIEKLVDPDSKRGDKDNLLSKPFESLAKVLEEIDD